MRSGWSSASIFWVLLAWGRFPVSKAIIPDGQEHFLTPSAHRDTHLFGGLGFRPALPYSATSQRKVGNMVCLISTSNAGINS